MRLKEFEIPEDIEPPVDDVNVTHEVGLFYNKGKDVLIGDSTPEYIELARNMSLLAEEHISSDMWRGLQNSSGQIKGGKVIKERRKIVHNEWQEEANEIWYEHPEWTKMDVAVQIKINLHSVEAADTISRRIKKPARKYKFRKG